MRLCGGMQMLRSDQGAFGFEKFGDVLYITAAGNWRHFFYIGSRYILGVP